MAKFKDLIISIVVSFSLSWLLFCFLFIYSYVKPDYSKKECEVVRQNFDEIKPGMSKEEVLLLINSEPRSKIFPYSGVFPEQKTQWEIWLLCADLDSCIVADSDIKTCYEWQMIAFDSKTEKVIKAFYDSPDRVGF